MGLPVLTTKTPFWITSWGAKSGGIITDDGGSSIVASGVCWSTLVDPTTHDSHTDDNKEVGEYFSQITGLLANTTYHVRAYATNSEGVSYGQDIPFKTPKAGVSKITQIRVGDDRPPNMKEVVVDDTLEIEL